MNKKQFICRSCGIVASTSKKAIACECGRKMERITKTEYQKITEALKNERTKAN